VPENWVQIRTIKVEDSLSALNRHHKFLFLVHAALPVRVLLYGRINSPSMTHENEPAEQSGEVGVTMVTVTTKCLGIVEQYQAGNIYKGDAIYEFAKAIPVGEDETAESPGKTLESYISMLDDWD